jgi:hypothetical protein
MYLSHFNHKVAGRRELGARGGPRRCQSIACYLAAPGSGMSVTAGAASCLVPAVVAGRRLCLQAGRPLPQPVLQHWLHRSLQLWSN